jgi:DNA-damage-inducible protein J
MLLILLESDMTTTTLHINVDEHIKAQADETLADLGLTVSDAVRLMLERIAAEKALPFEVGVPNALTAQTLEASERGEDLHVCRDSDELFEQLGI